MLERLLVAKRAGRLLSLDHQLVTVLAAFVFSRLTQETD
jgi:hypothetical protein